MQKFCKVFYNSLKYRFCSGAYFSFLRFCVFVFVIVFGGRARVGYIDVWFGYFAFLFLLLFFGNK
jgi:hypothetical protein